MARISDLDKTQYITVNGVKMTMADYKKSLKPKKVAKKRVRRTGEDDPRHTCDRRGRLP